MEVHLTPETESQLSRFAASRGRDADGLVQEVIRDFLNQEARFVAAVEAGEAALDRREFLSHAEVGAQVEKLVRD